MGGPIKSSSFRATVERRLGGKAITTWKYGELPFSKNLDMCYRPSVFQPSKMFGFDFNTYLKDMMVSNGNLRFLWHTLPNDK